MAMTTQRSLKHVPATTCAISTSCSIETSRQAERDTEEQETKNFGGHNNFGKLLDTYGNDFAVPDYTINDIRKAIPAELYERSATKGLLYLLRDILSVSVSFYLARTFITPRYVPLKAVRGVLWLVYGFVNGLFATGLWVLAHECGHQALSTSKVLNDTIGWIVHSALLVPYFSWKITHGKHHKGNGHMQRDMVFVPCTRAGFAKRFGIAFDELSELTEDAPLSSLLYVIARQLFGWNVYLLSNDTGHDYHTRQAEGRGYNPDGSEKHNGWLKGVNHFSPSSPLFEARDAKYILLSDLGILITASILCGVGRAWGFQSLFLWYFSPYLWVNHWLGAPVAITYLQHTDPSLAHYNPNSWTYARGAAATIDRDIGFIGHHLFHGITETHVLHHYVSTIPFYNATKASAAMQRVMGRHYRSTPPGSLLGFLKKLITNFRICQWVEPSVDAVGPGKDVLFYRNGNGVGVPPIDVRQGRGMGLFQ